IGQQCQKTRTLDRRVQLALVVRLGTGEPCGDDSAIVLNEIAQRLHVLVVDELDLLGGEATELPALEKGVLLLRTPSVRLAFPLEAGLRFATALARCCHRFTPFSPFHRSGLHSPLREHRPGKIPAHVPRAGCCGGCAAPENRSRPTRIPAARSPAAGPSHRSQWQRRENPAGGLCRPP